MENNRHNQKVDILSDLIKSSDSSNLKILFEQYKLYAQMADSISNRRNIANSFYISINGLILSGYFVIELSKIEMLFLALFGFLLNVSWILYLISSKQLNWAKFEVINKLEDHLPAKGFSVEWDLLTKLPKKSRFHIINYSQITNLYLIIPILFILGYTILLFAS